MERGMRKSRGNAPRMFLGTASFAVESFPCPCVVSCPFPLRRKSSLEEVFQRLEMCVRRRCVTYARVKFEGKRN